jgi:hypothetical protein
MSVALAFQMGVVGCGRDEAVTPGEVAEGDVSTDQLVTVRGEIEKQLDERSFTMSGTGEFFSDDLVVVSRNDLPVLNIGDEIAVTGTVRKVNHIEIERETNWKFNPQITIELESVTGYLVADSVRVIERD